MQIEWIQTNPSLQSAMWKQSYELTSKLQQTCRNWKKGRNTGKIARLSPSSRQHFYVCPCSSMNGDGAKWFNSVETLPANHESVQNKERGKYRGRKGDKEKMNNLSKWREAALRKRAIHTQETPLEFLHITPQYFSQRWENDNINTASIGVIR